jgi:cyclin-dependent kinase regulatory subunit CKS1
MPVYPEDIEYSDKYCDDVYEYRHVLLPKRIMKEMFRQMQNSSSIPHDPKRPASDYLRPMSESEWRGLGVQQSRGWQHYEVHRPEPHILLFRRPLGTNPVTGVVDHVALSHPVMTKQPAQTFC